MRKIIVAGFIIVSFLSCKKETTNNSNNNNSVSQTVFLYSGKILSHNFSSTSHDLIFRDYLRAEAPSSNSQYIELGTVTYNDSIFFKVPQGFYVFEPQNQNSSTGWSGFVGGGKKWTISGNSNSNIPAYSTTTLTDFPSLANTNFSSIPVIDKTSTFTVNWDNTLQGDSTEVILYGAQSINGIWVSSGMKQGSTNSYTYSNSQLQSLPVGNMKMQIISFKQKIDTVSGVEFRLYNTINCNTNIVVQ